MSARQCKRCAICYPVGKGFVKCPICSTQTSLKGKLEPDNDWERRVDSFKVPMEETGDPVFIWRFSQFLDLGFDPASAEMLADKLDGEDKVDLGEARTLIDGGCAPNLAVAILT